MKLLLSMPGGSEWIFLIVVLFGFILIPVLALYYYAKSKRLTKSLRVLQGKRICLLAKLLDKAN